MTIITAFVFWPFWLHEAVKLCAGVVKLVYTTDSKSVDESRGGSSPPTGTIYLFYFANITNLLDKLLIKRLRRVTKTHSLSLLGNTLIFIALIDFL